MASSLHKMGKKTAVFSFAGGAMIFLLYYFLASEKLLFVGLAYILVAGLINLVVLALVLTRAFKDRQQRRLLFRTAGLLLLNVPVVLVLTWFVEVLLNTLRVTIVNATGQDITNVVVEGCERKQVKFIKAGGRKTVWIGIHGDCGVFMTYRQGRARKSEAVAGYLTNGMGGKIKHRVGTNDISGI